MKSIRNHLRFSNVTSLLALFVALGGTAAAASVAANSVGTKQLRDQAVTTSKIKAGAVTGTKVSESTLGVVPRANTAKTAKAPARGAVHGMTLGRITTVSNAIAVSGSTPGQYMPTTGSTFVQCPAGTTVLSGGGAASDPDTVETLSRKSDPNGWRYDAFDGGIGVVTITVYAYCLNS